MMSMVSVYFMQNQDIKESSKEGFLPLLTEEDEEKQPVEIL